MGRHDQRGADSNYVCSNCKGGACEVCVDGLRVYFTEVTICRCKKKDHEDKMRGEPRLNQIADPFDGSVHAPGLVVTEDGTVTRDVKPYE
jgi:hypothetical protein